MNVKASKYSPRTRTTRGSPQGRHQDENSGDSGETWRCRIGRLDPELLHENVFEENAETKES